MISLDFQPCGDLFLLKTLLPWFSKCPHFPAFAHTIMQSPLWAPFFTHFFVSALPWTALCPPPFTFILFRGDLSSGDT